MTTIDAYADESIIHNSLQLPYWAVNGVFYGEHTLIQDTLESMPKNTSRNAAKWHTPKYKSHIAKHSLTNLFQQVFDGQAGIIVTYTRSEFDLDDFQRVPDLIGKIKTLETLNQALSQMNDSCVALKYIMDGANVKGNIRAHHLDKITQPHIPIELIHEADKHHRGVTAADLVSGFFSSYMNNTYTPENLAIKRSRKLTNNLQHKARLTDSLLKQWSSVCNQDFSITDPESFFSFFSEEKSMIPKNKFGLPILTLHEVKPELT